MAYTVNGIRFTYDYQELLRDIREDLEDGTLNKNMYINIVRGKERQLIGSETYRPVIDYYYPDDLQLMQTPLETIENQEEYTEKEWKQMLEEQKEMIQRYKRDEPFFAKTKVSDVLAEMELWNSII